MEKWMKAMARGGGGICLGRGEEVGVLMASTSCS